MSDLNFLMAVLLSGGNISDPFKEDLRTRQGRLHVERAQYCRDNSRHPDATIQGQEVKEQVMTILSNGILYTLKKNKYIDFLALWSEGKIPEGWLLANSKDIRSPDIDLDDFTPEQAKDQLKDIVFRI